MTIAIPLHKESEWAGHQELKYFLRSLDKHLKIPYNVKLYYNVFPDWLNPESLNSQQVERQYPKKALKYWKGKKQYENYFDTLNKLRIVSMDDEVDEDVLWCYDDQILLQDVYSFADISQWVAVKNYYEYKQTYDRRGNKWGRTVMKAFDLLVDQGRPLYDYETHLPRMFEKSRLKEMFETYPVSQQIIPYAPSTLYGNLYYDEPLYIMDKKNEIKLGLYGEAKRKQPGSFEPKTIDQIDNMKEDKLWMNYNDLGTRISPIFEWMKKEFPQKSQFEL
jgi:hypothetical protein